MRQSNSRAAAGWLAAFLLAPLAGCGGGSAAPTTVPQAVPPPPPPPTCDPPPEGVMASLPKGVFGGKIKGDPEERFILVTRTVPGYGAVQGYMFRGAELVSDSPQVTRLTRFGTATYCDYGESGTFNGTAWSFGADDVDAVYVRVNLDPTAPKVTGTLRYLEGAKTSYPLVGGPIAGTSYDPTAAPLLADVAGDWLMTNADGKVVQLSVASDGKIVGLFQGCAISGTLQTNPEGLNLFSAQFKFEAPCPGIYVSTPAGSSPIRGFALALPLTGGGTQLLLQADSDNGWGPLDLILAIGRR